MKIKRVPIKTLPPLPPELKNVIEHLEKEDQSQISRWTNEIVEWKYPRSDFFQFVAVLNRFDTILENICKEYELTQHVQKKHFDATIKQTLLSILNFTRLLFDHCSNRSLYNSFEHLNSLLYTTDIDVLETTLALLIKPAQRMSNPTAAHSNFSIQKDKVITELARSGDIISSNDTQQENKLVMSYYKEEEMGELETIEYTIVPEKENDLDLFWTLVKKHQVPSEYHFELLNKIRLTNHKNNNNITRQLLKIRFMSIVILGWLQYMSINI
ncbi:hypothetical protein CU097_014604 [Rhizopus azygosporus]|uniref:DUF908 domain-containing protein n=1 Tax=Rhizopus azygosporus TaxID=86630 RepID=A0A367K100_RHIAZ|nr:hypothetical protein CU097_014604 [Rhizopus azygosporus]